MPDGVLGNILASVREFKRSKTMAKIRKYLDSTGTSPKQKASKKVQSEMEESFKKDAGTAAVDAPQEKATEEEKKKQQMLDEEMRKKRQAKAAMRSKKGLTGLKQE